MQNLKINIRTRTSGRRIEIFLFLYKLFSRNNKYNLARVKAMKTKKERIMEREMQLTRHALEMQKKEMKIFESGEQRILY